MAYKITKYSGEKVFSTLIFAKEGGGNAKNGIKVNMLFDSVLQCFDPGHFG